MSAARISGRLRTARLLAAAGCTSAALGALALLSPACRGSDWVAGRDLIAPPRRVAQALGEPLLPPADEIDPASVPRLDPPRHVRPCCSFGMDLRVEYQGAIVPGYVKANVTGPDELGHHEYDNGFVS